MRRAAFVMAVAGLGGCVWSDFDDLQDNVWLDRVGAIEGSTAFGEVVVEASAGPPPSGGALIAVIGRTRPSVSRLAYGADGGRDLFAANIANDLPFLSVLDENPVYASDPGSDQVAFAALTGVSGDGNRGLNIAVYSGFTAGGQPQARLLEPMAEFAGPEEPTALAFVTGTELLVGRRGRIQRVVFDAPDEVFLQCTIDMFENETPFAIAIADADGDTNLDYIIASAPEANPQPRAPEPGRLWTVPADPAIFLPGGPCPAPTRVLTSDANVELAFDFGTQIAVADFGSGPRVLVSTAGASGKIAVVDFTQATPVGTALGASLPGLDAFTVDDIGGAAGPEIIVGLPRTTMEDKVNAGSVRVLDANGAIQAELYDANPSEEQHFGKSVAVVPFGSAGKKVLVVGAEGEVFTYFRTTLYDEVRSNR